MLSVLCWAADCQGRTGLVLLLIFQVDCRVKPPPLRRQAASACLLRAANQVSRLHFFMRQFNYVTSSLLYEIYVRQQRFFLVAPWSTPCQEDVRHWDKPWTTGPDSADVPLPTFLEARAPPNKGGNGRKHIERRCFCPQRQRISLPDR